MRVARPSVRQKDPRQAQLGDRRGDWALLDLRQRKGREDDGSVLLADQGQPSLQLRPERRIHQGKPGFVHQNQRRPTVQVARETMEEIGQHGRGRGRAQQALGLEGLDRGGGQRFMVGVEQPSPRPRQGVGRQGVLQVQGRQ